ncbi:MAG: hypothetical protein Q7U82_05900 [Gammaproteobacteria bacterium]|nr:hypothetical protein [Gammaproteobacteria bacterium]
MNTRIAAARLLMEAGAAHRDGNYAEALSLTCKALEQMFARREPSVIRALLREYPWPSGATRLLHTEVGPRIELSPQDFCAEASRQFLDYAAGMPVWFSRRTLVEAVYVFLQRRAADCLESALAIKQQQRILLCLHRLRAPLQSRLPAAAAHREAVILGLSPLLHEPHAALRRLLQQHDFYFEYNYAKRCEHDAAAESLPAQPRFVWPDREAYAALVRRHPGSRVLVTIHMGDFVGAFRCIAEQVEDGRTVMSLQRESRSPEADAPGAALHLQVLRHGADAPAEAVAGLRKGDRSLGVLFDLRDDFGTTTEVMFFGCRAHLVKGPALLAIIGRAPIIPFVTWECAGVDVIEMEDLIDTRVLHGESVGMAATRITQRLALLAERWIRRAPAQWKYLPALPGYCHRNSRLNGQVTALAPGGHA